MTSETIGKQEMKRRTKAHIQQAFEDAGFVAVERSAGAVNYIALKPSMDTQYVAASIYGDRRGAASIWVKDDVFHALKAKGKVSADEDRTIQDVSFFKRGMAWKIKSTNLRLPRKTFSTRQWCGGVRPKQNCRRRSREG